MSPLHAYLIAVVLVAVAARITWFLSFARRSWTTAAANTPVAGRIRKLRKDALLPQRLTGRPEVQLARYSLFNDAVVTSYTLGGLALAGWSILAADSARHQFALGMLGTAVVVGIGAPLLFRYRGGEVTRMGLESGLSVAGLALVMAMLSLLQGALAGAPWPIWLARVVPAVLILRELRDTQVQMSLTRQAFAAPPAAGEPQAASAPAAGA